MNNIRVSEDVLAMQIADILKFIASINQIIDEYLKTTDGFDDGPIEEWQNRRTEWFAQLSELLAKHKIKAELTPLAA